jgi:hypothetical protein
MLIINPIPIHLAAFYLHRDKMTLLSIECSSGSPAMRFSASRTVVFSVYIVSSLSRHPSPARHRTCETRP